VTSPHPHHPTPECPEVGSQPLDCQAKIVCDPLVETKGESYRLQGAKARTRRAKPTTDLSGSQPVDQAQIAK
jgi:hypothetical protein